jgi:hypothetical protein
MPSSVKQWVFAMRGVVFSAVVLSALATGGAGLALAQTPVSTAPAAYTVEPFTPPSQIAIQGTGVRLRAEPFATSQAQVLSTGSTGLALNVVGIARLPDWNWYQVVLKNGQKAFIRSDYTSAPSKGAASAAPLPAATRVEYPPVSATAPRQTTPVAPLPAPTRIEYPPISTAPTQRAPTAPQTSDAPISLVPTSPLPEARSSNSGGLTSVDPALTPH